MANVTFNEDLCKGCGLMRGRMSPKRFCAFRLSASTSKATIRLK